MSKPFVKWVGGKRALLSELLKYVPIKKIRKYHEPMVGGGALFFTLATQGRFKKAKISDTNEELIAAYTSIRDNPTKLVKHLNILTKEHNNAKLPNNFYYSIRAYKLEDLSIIQKAARFIYLNKAGFNGLYRVNRAGRFNVPTGHKDTVKLYDMDNIIHISTLLKNVEITIQDFEAAIDFDTVGKGDFVYFDPPYWPVEKTSFVAYTAAGFDGVDHARLADTAKRLKHKGVRVVLSNSDTPSVKWLYKDMIMERVPCPRKINSNGKGRGNVGELIIRSHK